MRLLAVKVLLLPAGKVPLLVLVGKVLLLPPPPLLAGKVPPQRAAVPQALPLPHQAATIRRL